ncbi:MAG: diguanylate cyclase, partial [Spirochaetaceae bacterium]|nr:diguanylate cyclase [Spirochaetaceae bacterium]
LSLLNELNQSALPLLRENIYSEIEKQIMPAIQISSMMARDSFLISWVVDGEKNLRSIQRYLLRIKEDYGFVSSFFISQESSVYYHFEGINKVIDPTDEHDSWYYDFVLSGKEYDLDVDLDEAADDQLTIFINFRVENEQGRFLGVSGVGLQMENFSQMLKDRQEHYQRQIYLVDLHGVIQAHSDMSNIETRSLLDRPGLVPQIDKLLQIRDEPINVLYQQGRRRKYITSRYIPDLQWFLVVEQDEHSALKAARENLWRTLITGGLATLLILVISSYIFKYFTGEMEVLATTDPLTGTSNRRELDDQLQLAYSRQNRNQLPLSLVLMDLDLFKEINDKYGHAEGDKVLQTFCEIIIKEKRPHDLLARWGGDEFILIFEGVQEEAQLLLKRVRQSLVDLHSTGGIPFCFSAGIAQLKSGESLEDLQLHADKALYYSKNRGRNKITIFENMDEV